MLAIRIAQAGLVARIWESLRQEVGTERASAILVAAIAADARCAGETFARTAPGRASLHHFATVLDRWQDGGALNIKDIRLTETALHFAVTACGYAQSYADMGLAPELGSILSCSRDEPFAQGYSPNLSMYRSRTIMQGAPACLFTFTWAS